MGYTLGYNPWILSIDPNFQRDIQVGGDFFPEKKASRPTTQGQDAWCHRAWQIIPGLVSIAGSTPIYKPFR